MFRQLSKNEAAEFRLWARRNYTPGTEISELWHLVVQDECRRMCEENGIQFGTKSKEPAEQSLALKN